VLTIGALLAVLAIGALSALLTVAALIADNCTHLYIVVVADQGPLGETVLGLTALQVPDNDGLVTVGRNTAAADAQGAGKQSVAGGIS
jgi:hypothetical protein